MLFDFLKNIKWKKRQAENEGHWRAIPFLGLDVAGYRYVINPDGVIRRLRTVALDDADIMKPYPYPEEFGGDLVCIGFDKFFCYIDGPALADVIFDKPGSDAGRKCVFFTGYKRIEP